MHREFSLFSSLASPLMCQVRFSLPWFCCVTLHVICDVFIWFFFRADLVWSALTLLVRLDLIWFDSIDFVLAPECLLASTWVQKNCSGSRAAVIYIYVNIFDIFWNHFGVSVGSIWGHCGWVWDRFGICLKSFTIILGSLWDNFGITLAYFCDNLRITFGWRCDHFGIDLAFGEPRLGFGGIQNRCCGTARASWGNGGLRRGTACRGLDHTVLYLKSKNPKGKPR